MTLVGPPGSGKTRLAQLVAVESARRVAHGSVFVDLVPVNTHALFVVLAIAAALGTRDMGGRDLAETLTIVLRGHELFLVLDSSWRSNPLSAHWPNAASIQSLLTLSGRKSYEQPPRLWSDPLLTHHGTTPAQS